MSKRKDFTQQEWIKMRAVFDAILLRVAVADNRLSDAEAKAWRAEVDALAEDATAMVQALLRPGFDAEEDQAVIAKAANTPFEDLVREAMATLNAKAEPEEVADYQRSVRSLAVAVAEGETGGDQAENQWLAQLNTALAES